MRARVCVLLCLSLSLSVSDCVFLGEREEENEWGKRQGIKTKTCLGTKNFIKPSQ